MACFGALIDSLLSIQTLCGLRLTHVAGARDETLPTHTSPVSCVLVDMEILLKRAVPLAPTNFKPVNMIIDDDSTQI